MHRQNFAFLMIAATSFGLASVPGAIAQQSSTSGAYSGVSKPPADAIEASPDAPPAKPAAGKLAQPAGTAVAAQAAPQPSSAGPAAPPEDYTSQSGEQQAAQQPLNTRPVPAPYDPDGDIVHPLRARPGELMEGSTIQVRLIERLSSAMTEKGEPFHGQVAFDVMQSGKVLIPAGSTIEGHVSAVSTGQHLGGHGSFRLRPEMVILPDGSRFTMHAETTGAPGSHARIGSEGTINPGSRAKRDGIEYGSVVGAGAITGAVVGGPVGALAGGLIGAGVVTGHLAVDHPQAVLEPGAMVLFTLTEPMNLTPQNPQGN